MYQILLKEYDGSRPVRNEMWILNEEEQIQSRTFEEIPVYVECSRKKLHDGRCFEIKAKALENLKLPVSLSLEIVEEKWKGTEYVFMPAAVYDGNRFESKYIPYPPYWAEKTEDGWKSVVTDIPRLSKDGVDRKIQFLSGDMSTPAMGYFREEEQEGMILLAKHMEAGRYNGFTVEEKGGKAYFRVSVPGVREEKVYFFGELPDGTGFYPTCDYPSTDEGKILKAGEILSLTAEHREFQADNIIGYLRTFNEIRENEEQPEEFFSIPFSVAYRAVKEKYVKMNFCDEGYLKVGTGAPIPAHWQSGWVGGGMNTLSFLLEDEGKARKQAMSTLNFIIEKLQRTNGWYVPMYADGNYYGDAFENTDQPVLLVRKDADLLYFMLKQALYLREQGTLPEGMDESVRLQADALVSFFRKNRQLGQFIDMEKEEILAGGTASAAISSAALALAYEYFGKEEYIVAAEELGDLYWKEHLRKGMVNGGPGEICQAPDSESAFGLLESFVQLYETTGKEKWLRAAIEAFELAVTWVVSYDFTFPAGSTAAQLGVHTAGTVFANAQNKHSAPGICTLSGNSLLKLYRFTGDQKYLKWMGRISHALSQFVSLKERPVNTLDDVPLVPGYFNERVQMSDWEGKHTVGEFLNDSNWPEVTMLLTYVEIPGIYVDLDRNVIQCSDHLKVESVDRGGNGVALRIENPTVYDADVTVMIDHSENRKKLGHNYYSQMKKIHVSTRMKLTFFIYGHC